MSYEPFSYEGEPDSCLWCGRKLRAYRWRNEDTAKAMGKERGDYGDGHFCGLRCGYQFAVRFADLGRRLTRIGEGK